tara:strand:+ start:2411 stop:4309 length:1899 start_codon:yes stop_codon:yes gene_type:complete
MGSFTQGGIAFGQSIGGGIENYAKGRERRELLVGKALGIQKQLLQDPKRTDEDNKYLKKFEDINELGTRQLQSLISEFETGEELQMIDLNRRLKAAQTRAAEAKLKSMEGLGRFTKDMAGMEEGFEGDAYSFPAYLSRDYLEGDRGQRDIAAGAFPGEHYGDESRAIYEEVSSRNPYLEEVERQRVDDAEWLKAGQAEPPAPRPRRPRSIGLLSESALRGMGGSPKDQEAFREYNSINRSIRGLERYFDGDPDLESYEENRDKRFGTAQPSASEIKRDLAKKRGEKASLISDHPWLVPPKEEMLEPYDVPAPAISPEAVRDYVTAPPAPQGVEKRLVGYETYGDDDIAPQDQPLDRSLVTGGTPAASMDERRATLIDALAQYDLTPEDRRQAINMISEKYPKLKEFATEVITADGEELGYNIDGTFVKKAKGRVSTPQGWRVKSRSVNQKTGEETVTFENPRDLPTYVPTASKYAEADPELTLKNENAPSEGQAKEFNTAFVSAKGIVEDARYLIDMTKDASFFKQRLLDREFKAKVNERIAMMKGQMRLLIVGPGAMSEMEQKMLADALPDPSDFFRLDSATIARLEGLEYLSNRKLKLQGEAIGLWDYKKADAGGAAGATGSAEDELGIL